MELSEYFRRIFQYTDARQYYPNRKNSGIFVSFCFIEAGSNYFSHKQGDRLKSDDVPLERKLYDGSRKMSQELKDSFKSFRSDDLCVYFEKIIDKNKYDDVMLAFAIPPTEEKNPQALRRALADQFKEFIDSEKDDVADIVAMQYQRYLDEENPDQSSYHHFTSLYPNDVVYMKPDFQRNYSGFMYEKLIVTWKFSNLGEQTWRNRKLYLSNYAEIRLRAENNYIEIPETPPNTGVEISTIFELRPFEGNTLCHWVMIDGNGNDCYPGSRMFDICELPSRVTLADFQTTKKLANPHKY